MLHKITKEMDPSPEVEPDFSDIVAGVFQRDILEPNVFLLFLDCILRPSKNLLIENSFTSEKPRSRLCPTENVTHADLTDYLGLLAINQPSQNPCSIVYIKQKELLAFT